MPQELTKRVSSQSKGDLLRSTSLLPSSPLGLQNAGIPLGPVGRPNPGLELQLRACDGALGPIRARVRHGSGRLKGAGTRDGNTMEQTHEIHNILHILSYYIYIYICFFLQFLVVMACPSSRFRTNGSGSAGQAAHHL